MGKRQLYSVAYEKQTKKGWVSCIEYFHATDYATANAAFRAANHKNRFKIHIVGIAPVVGYFEDEKEPGLLIV